MCNIHFDCFVLDFLIETALDLFQAQPRQDHQSGLASRSRLQKICLDQKHENTFNKDMVFTIN